MLIDSLWNLIENSNHSETDIHINTNGTIWNEEIQNILLKFRSVQLDISIDGINDRFEYMRFPAKWDTVEHNIDRYKELAENNSHINLHIIITVSALNIYYADETWEYFNNKKINSGFNILHQPYHLNMRILPTEIKRIISKKLIDSNTQAASLIDTLNINSENQEKNFSEFIRITSMHDEIRKESYAKVFPEMFNILDNSR
jgi:MoaA/NifB/PqqE/SkfB family radical SAM enzyme